MYTMRRLQKGQKNPSNTSLQHWDKDYRHPAQGLQGHLASEATLSNIRKYMTHVTQLKASASLSWIWRDGRNLIKQWSELRCFVKVYFCFTLLSMLALLILAIINMAKEGWKEGEDDDLSVSLIQFVGILHWNIQYATTLETPYQFTDSFCHKSGHLKLIIGVRFVCIMCVGVVHLICGGLLISRSDTMAFRVGGALESLQKQYFFLNLCFSMVTFDFQAQLCLCILILTSGPSVSSTHITILVIGVIWALISTVTGAISVLKEVKTLVWIFVLQNLPQLAYFIYLLYTIISDWGRSPTYILEAASITGCVISVIIKCVLFWGLFHLYRRFGQGLRENSK
ncbi:hypothetical protein Baya_7507 [Bagarius yarrelli]|uniref:DUF7789 domain-containing protein n=1 Tax=Bagarius yarrelli TaxID=175774 RepID=A0A556U1X7_BAGYA|nr:hypothetical protein Baya_7507 [Bagarius yarrelli]